MVLSPRGERYILLKVKTVHCSSVVFRMDLGLLEYLYADTAHVSNEESDIFGFRKEIVLKSAFATNI